MYGATVTFMQGEAPEGQTPLNAGDVQQAAVAVGAELTRRMVAERPGHVPSVHEHPTDEYAPVDEYDVSGVSVRLRTTLPTSPKGLNKAELTLSGDQQTVEELIADLRAIENRMVVTPHPPG